MKVDMNKSIMSCGTGTSFIINNEGVMYATGLNHFNQLGIQNVKHNCRTQTCKICLKNMSCEYFVPVCLRECEADGLSAVSCRLSHVGALSRYDGRFFTWGDNTRGQLGNGKSCVDAQSPKQVMFYICISGLKCLMPPVAQVCCGRKHTIILTQCGRIMTCGDNAYGQLGVGEIIGLEKSDFFVDVKQHLLEIFVNEFPIVQNVQAGDDVCSIITKDNKLMTWGLGTSLQLGYIPQNTMISRGIQFVPWTVVCSTLDSNGQKVFVNLLISTISFSSDHTACICLDQNLYTWGTNTSGKLGNGNRTSNIFPRVACTKNILQAVPIIVSCGGFHTLVVTDKKTLWTCGSGKFGAGHGLFPPCCLLFRQVYIRNKDNKKTSIIGADAGKTHSLIITDDNLILTCGKMKTSMYRHSNNPLSIDTFDGFGGLGYFRGMASSGCVKSFQTVIQLKDMMGFGVGFSMLMRNKIQTFIIGIYFDKTHKQNDRAYMNDLHSDIIDMIISCISGVSFPQSSI